MSKLVEFWMKSSNAIIMSNICLIVATEWHIEEKAIYTFSNLIQI